MNDFLSTADIASSNAYDAQRRLEIVEKRQVILYRALRGEYAGKGAEFERDWLAALPKPAAPTPIDYSKMPGYRPLGLLGDPE